LQSYFSGNLNALSTAAKAWIGGNCSLTSPNASYAYGPCNLNSGMRLLPSLFTLTLAEARTDLKSWREGGNVVARASGYVTIKSGDRFCGGSAWANPLPADLTRSTGTPSSVRPTRSFVQDLSLPNKWVAKWEWGCTFTFTHARTRTHARARTIRQCRWHCDR
jgi:hypothetical protein